MKKKVIKENKPYEFLVSFNYLLKNLSEPITGFGNLLFKSDSKFLDPFANENFVIKSIKDNVREKNKEMLDKEYYRLEIVILAISRIK